MQQEIKDYILKDLEKLGYPQADFVVESPKDISNGDFSTNVALALSKQVGKSPREIADSLVSLWAGEDTGTFSKIEVAGPGFINFYLPANYFSGTIQKIISEKESWGMSDAHKGKSILVEHSSPNLFKAFHVGHVMNNAIGESIKRLAQFSGAQVTTISYPSDVSLGIAKAVYILMQEGGLDKLRSISLWPSKEVEYLGQCYVRGTREYDEKPEIVPVVREIANDIYHKKNTEAYRVYEDAAARNIAAFKAITATLGSTFDGFIYESEAGEVGKEIVKDNIGKVFKESDGAVIYEGEQDGLHTRVFINKEGNPTYEAKDAGLMELKFSRFAPDASIFVTDHEQTEYFKVVLAAVRKISKTWSERADKTIHRTHGRMSFKGQKMSSRLGGVPSAQILLDTLYEELQERSPDLAFSEVQTIAVAALKFAILRVSAGKNINFDPEVSLSFEGDSGPYLQYSTVRAQSVLSKGGEMNASLPESWETTTLEKLLIRFPESVDRSVQEWSPHHLVVYLLELSQAFNSWYGNTKIIDESVETPYRLALTAAFAQTMNNGLNLLGISVPARM